MPVRRFKIGVESYSGGLKSWKRVCLEQVCQFECRVQIQGVNTNAGRRDDIRRLFENYSQPNQQGQAHKPGSLVLTSRDGSESRPSSPSRPGSPEKQSQDDHRNSTAGRGSFPGAQGEEMPLDFGIRAHRPKRIRTAANERPPCLRCRILKKKVSYAVKSISLI